MAESNPPEFGPPIPALPPNQVSAETPPQFSTAEYAHVPGTEKCRVCSRALSGEYYRVNGQMACAICARQGSEGQPSDSHAAFARALVFGIGAAILGLVGYAGVEIVSHITIGYLALAVGWLVAIAMMKGSNGIGGRRYQVVAVLLTYAAISMAAVPVYLATSQNHRSGNAVRTSSQNSASDDQTNSDSDANKPAKKPKMNLVMAIGILVGIGLASPFLELASPLHGIIGLVILFVGLRIAWQMTRAKALAVDGPYPLNT